MKNLLYSMLSVEGSYKSQKVCSPVQALGIVSLVYYVSLVLFSYLAKNETNRLVTFTTPISRPSHGPVFDFLL